MTTRKGQRLVNYVRQRMKMETTGDIPTTAEIDRWQALVETYIFNMTDAEFQKAINSE